MILRFLPLLLLIACRRMTPTPPVSASATSRAAARFEVAETIFEGGFKNGWQDWGWSPRETKSGPASVDFGKWGGWILAKPTLSGRYGGLVFRMKPPDGEAELLEVRVESNAKTVFPRVKLRADHRLDVGDGWVEVLVPMTELDPDGAPFDRVVFRAFRETPSQRTLLDKIALTRFDEAAAAASAAKVLAEAKPASFSLECRGAPKKISPFIYGAAWDIMKFDDRAWKMGATVRRWGGNVTTRYNWELKNAWNTGSDWFFENVEIKPYTEFLSDNAAHKGASALTVPMIGWVSKDTTSYSFPTSVYGKQQFADETKRDPAGNGNDPSGKPIAPGAPSRTSVAAPPEFVARWVQKLKSDNQPVDIFILDNEPGLWNSTHRDVHPEPLTYDELLDRTIRYGTAVRNANPSALIAGPAEWGWVGYLYSAKDAKVSFTLRPIAACTATCRSRPGTSPSSPSTRRRPAPRSSICSISIFIRRGREHALRRRGRQDSRAPPPSDAWALGPELLRRVMDQGAHLLAPAHARLDRQELPGARDHDRRVELRRRGPHERRARHRGGARQVRAARGEGRLLLDRAARFVSELLGLPRLP